MSKMTNFEKYKDDILGLPENTIIAVADGKIVNCNKLECKNCDLDSDKVNCNYGFVRWLYEEVDSDNKETKSKEVNNDSHECKDCEYNDKNRDGNPCINCSNRYPLLFEPKLKPCPYCGGKAKKEEIRRDWNVKCEDCQSSTRVYPTPEEAIEAWNMRV